jgi:molybdopterin converting factor small subunit
MVGVRIFGYLASMVGRDAYAVAAGSVREALEDLVGRMPPELRHHVQDPATGAFGGFYLVLNEKNLTLPHALDLKLGPGDVLAVVSPVAGG